MRLFRSAIVGLITAIAVGVLAFALERFVDAVGIYLMPAGLVVPLVGPLIPSRVVYWVIPDGGAPAGLLLILSSALLFWTVMFGAVHFAWASLRSRRIRARTRPS